MKIFVVFNGRMLGALILAAVCGTFPLFAVADCSPTSVLSSTTTLSLSDTYSTGTSFSATYNTGWSGHMVCDASAILGNTLYYVSALTGGYPVRFLDTSKGLDQIITFNATPSKTSSWFWVVGTNNAENIDYTFTATLGNTTSSGALATTTTGSVSIVTIAYTNSNSYTPATIRANYLTDSGIKAYSLLNVTFDPTATTCSVDNQSFTLPAVTLASLRTGSAADANFSFSVDCSGQLNYLTTRPVNLRLYSNDLVDNSNYVIRNSSSTSAGIGFQLFSGSADPLIFKNIPDSTASSLWAMTKGATLTQSDSVQIGARYKIFDDGAASAGSVVGTVIAYFDYD